MGLDEFRQNTTGEKPDGSEYDLSNNAPPGDAERWSSHEPGPPSWLQYIEAKETENDIEGSDEDDMLVISFVGVPTSELKSDNPANLAEKN